MPLSLDKKKILNSAKRVLGMFRISYDIKIKYKLLYIVNVNLGFLIKNNRQVIFYFLFEEEKKETVV